MKKILIKLAFFAVMATLVFALIACGDENNKSLSETKTHLSSNVRIISVIGLSKHLQLVPKMV